MQCCAIWCIGAVSSASLRCGETGDAFPTLCECWVETGVAFARVGRASTETAVALAGEKWVFLVRFSVALVMAVSRWSASVPAEVSLVSKSARGRVLCAKKFALRLCFSAKARKSSPRMPKTAEKRCFQARWANFFAEMPLEGPRWANFFAGKLLEAPRWANFVAHAGAPTHVRSLRCPPCLQWWGFRATRVASRIVV